MATLMRAKTAYTKAKAVDKLQLALDYVAKEINEAVSYGHLDTNVFVGDEYADGVRAALLAAGYSVSSPMMMGIVPEEVPYTKKGFFAKFLAWFDRDDSPGDGIYHIGLGSVSPGYLKVDWRPIKETQ